jgi:DNA-binding FadR family transcriptional regulator
MKTRKKSGFEVRWVRLPLRWIRILHQAAVSTSTYDLALTILVESFKREQMAVKEIILSEGVTGMSPTVRRKAISNLVRLNLIKVKRGKGKAVRVVDLYI